MVVHVGIEGNRALSAGTICAGLATYSDNWSLGDDKPLLDRTVLPADAARIESLYQAHGYFEAQVTGFRVVQRDPQTVRVYFRVREGEPVRVRDVAATDLTPPSAADPEAAARLGDVNRKLKGLIPFRPGDVWQAERHERAKEQIRTALRERGFLFAEVLGDVLVDRRERTAVVQYHIVPGPLARIREVRITGNRRVAAARIARRIPLRAGEIVVPRRLRETEENIYALRAFFGVRAEAVRPSVEEQLGQAPLTFENLKAIVWEPQVVVEVDVQEMPIHDVSVGVGATIDNRRNEVYLKSGYENRNFIGGLRYFALEARPALVALPTLIDPDAQYAFGAAARLNFVQPSFFEEYLEARLETDYRLGVEYGYKSHKVSFSPGLSRKLWRRLTAALAYRLTYYSYFDYSSALNLDPADTMGLAFRPEYLLSYLEQSLVFDGRDSVYDPRSGFYGSATVAESFTAFGSDFHFIRLDTTLRGYVTPWRRLTLAMQLHYGQTFNAYGAETPLAARFLGGGPSSVRGFGAGRMGPYVCRDDQGGASNGQDDQPCSGSKVFVGGNLILEGNVEARFYLPANLGFVLFADVGEIWPSKDDLAFGDLNVAVGPGLRYFTPIGPVRLDAGVLVTEPARGAYALHVSIGQAF